jgi:hypothetical protein
MIVSVSGACSKAGKTAAAVSLVEALDHSAVAVKFTTTEDVFKRCPRGSPCVVCDIEEPFRLVEDPGVLLKSGTDTDRLAAAGANRVIWAIAKRSHADEAWAAVRSGRRGDEPVVIEGSTIVGIARPDANVFVVHPFLAPERWKSGSEDLVRSADLVVVNIRAKERRAPAQSVISALERHRDGREIRVANVTRPLAEWAPDLLSRLDVPSPNEDLARAEPRLR